MRGGHRKENLREKTKGRGTRVVSRKLERREDHAGTETPDQMRGGPMK